MILNKNSKVHCFFEQSGTFKDEFIKLGYIAYDYDILDDFNKTNFRIDLFSEIIKAYNDDASIFDNITADDLIIAFFPCIRFEHQIILWFQGKAHGINDCNLIDKFNCNLKLHDELSYLYEIITKLVIICLKRNIKLIIENPFSSRHYLIRYWCCEPTIIDYDRTLRGDYFSKPTAYYFFNCEPSVNLLLEGVDLKIKKTIAHTNNKVARSLISPDYAYRFIREFIL